MKLLEKASVMLIGLIVRRLKKKSPKCLCHHPSNNEQKKPLLKS